MTGMVVMEFNTSDENDTYYYLDGAAPCHNNNMDLNSTGLAVTYIIVVLVSLLGNSLVIYVICCMERRKTSTDVYLMNLALADLLFSLTLPLWAVYVHSEWIFGTTLCRLASGLQETTFYGGVLLLGSISVDRYLAIVKATQVIVHKRHLVSAVCALVWLVAGMLALPVCIHKEAFQPSGSPRYVCHDNVTGKKMEQWQLSMRLLRYIVGFFIPLMVMIFCYGSTSCTLYRSRNSQKHKAMRVILSVVLAFVLCWLPYNIAVLVDILMRGNLLDESCDLRQQVAFSLMVTEILAFSHCAVNPVLYAFIGQKFRDELLTTLFKHGLINKKVLSTYRKNSVYSFSGNTSITR
ncbi:C-X-C chemokine receptor type 1 [Paramormyrops kingsleyae]|uniref:C-X-C chemokine receptor type 2 n=1 Tax=Paramormyrops kingsleyae TaxID=1676925 RepID=A0A3B3Q4H1_9TELE|nr:C-X-C chemokine receptor type 1-like [Paramormyrops kingsleyae]